MAGTGFIDIQRIKLMQICATFSATNPDNQAHLVNQNRLDRQKPSVQLMTMATE